MIFIVMLVPCRETAVIKLLMLIVELFVKEFDVTVNICEEYDTREAPVKKTLLPDWNLKGRKTETVNEDARSMGKEKDKV